MVAVPREPAGPGGAGAFACAQLVQLGRLLGGIGPGPRLLTAAVPVSRALLTDVWLRVDAVVQLCLSLTPPVLGVLSPSQHPSQAVLPLGPSGQGRGG